ncbi:MAG: CDP-alcohol phosphatidyltransferase family protein [Acidimicrobiales bacterium]|nr:CDP-alcohol phosphatidyltransferase family protein [Acidimicrobiales bacterium]
MFDLALRPVKDRLLTPVADRVAGFVSANAVTAVGLLCGVACAVTAAAGHGWVSLVLWLGGRTVDGLDGLVARRRGEATDLGGYLDMLADTVAYTAVPIGLAVHAGHRSVWVATAVLLGSFYVNTMSWAYLSALLEKRGQGVAGSGEPTSIRMPAGLVEGAETVALYALFLVLPGRVVWLFGTMAVLVALTVAQRVRWAQRVLRGSTASPQGRLVRSVEER